MNDNLFISAKLHIVFLICIKWEKKQLTIYYYEIREYIPPEKLIYNKVSKWVKVSWKFIDYGVKRNFIDYQFAIDYANDIIDETNINEDLITLCDSKPHFFEVPYLVTKFAKQEQFIVNNESLWSLVYFSYIKNNINDFSDFISLLYLLHEDFDNKEETKNFSITTYYDPERDSDNQFSFKDELFKYVESRVNIKSYGYNSIDL